jgi:NADH-quinone oxidoreductase subunit I
MKNPLTLPGLGILKGMVVTARNLVGSYYGTKRLHTISYPEERLALPENSRNFPFLVYDGEDADGGLRCTACRICEKECPPQVITIVPERDENGKLTKHPTVFDIDLNACMSCQICVEVCPFESIKMDSAFEYSSFEHVESLVLHKSDLAKPNSYYHDIKPTEATAVDANLEVERQRKAEAAAKKEAALQAKKAAAAAKSAAADAEKTPPTPDTDASD